MLFQLYTNEQYYNFAFYIPIEIDVSSSKTYKVKLFKHDFLPIAFWVNARRYAVVNFHTMITHFWWLQMYHSWGLCIP